MKVKTIREGTSIRVMLGNGHNQIIKPYPCLIGDRDDPHAYLALKYAMQRGENVKAVHPIRQTSRGYVFETESY
jgi:hypothetical protein